MGESHEPDFRRAISRRDQPRVWAFALGMGALVALLIPLGTGPIALVARFVFGSLGGLALEVPVFWLIDRFAFTTRFMDEARTVGDELERVRDELKRWDHHHSDEVSRLEEGRQELLRDRDTLKQRISELEDPTKNVAVSVDIREWLDSNDVPAHADDIIGLWDTMRSDAQNAHGYRDNEQGWEDLDAQRAAFIDATEDLDAIDRTTDAHKAMGVLRIWSQRYCQFVSTGNEMVNKICDSVWQERVRVWLPRWRTNHRQILSRFVGKCAPGHLDGIKDEVILNLSVPPLTPNRHEEEAKKRHKTLQQDPPPLSLPDYDALRSGRSGRRK